MPDGELSEFQYKLALEQAEWRGGVTNELENINKVQSKGFASINKRLDRLEECFNQEIEKIENEGIKPLQKSINGLQKKAIKITTTIALIVPIIFFILKSILKF